jgi:hypothetical protein
VYACQTSHLCVCLQLTYLPGLLHSQVHLHEQFGNVFVDSCGGAVEAWVSPAAPVTLQVAAGGGIALDPGLRVRGSRAGGRGKGSRKAVGMRAKGQLWPAVDQRWHCVTAVASCC